MGYLEDVRQVAGDRERGLCPGSPGILLGPTLHHVGNRLGRKAKFEIRSACFAQTCAWPAMRWSKMDFNEVVIPPARDMAKASSPYDSKDQQSFYPWPVDETCHSAAPPHSFKTAEADVLHRK